MEVKSRYDIEKMIPQEWIMTEDAEQKRQALIVYLSFNCRTGGTNWANLKANFDGAEIRAGQGYYGIDELLSEHVDKANANSVPYKTSWQLDPNEGATAQIDRYFAAYGVAGHRMSLAVEKTSHGTMSATNTRVALAHLQIISGEVPELYVGVPVLDAWGWPAWLKEYTLQIARYPYAFEPDENGDYVQYLYIEDFIKERGWTFPKGVTEEFKPYVQFWQCSEKIDARKYFANLYTDDPTYGSGLRSGTFSVSTIMDYEQALEWLCCTETDPDPDPDQEDWQAEIARLDTEIATLTANQTALQESYTVLSAAVDELNVRVNALEAEESRTITMLATDKVVAFYIYDYNDAESGPKPIMVKYEPVIKYTAGKTLEVYPGLIDADGSIDYYKMEQQANGNDLYCRADKVKPV